jgi:uncharacterized cofD-like protein
MATEELRRESEGRRLVAIGGGTGLSTLLRGVKLHTRNISAVVTVSDDGGSSGRLRRELGVLPPGDIRNCLVALADSESLMTALFKHRFRNGKGSLDGHSFGNLLIAALTEVIGDFEQAVKESSKVLAIRGRVLPSTVEDIVLLAELEDGTRVEGESLISRSRCPIRRVSLRPESPAPLPEAIQEIEQAEVIVIGPGSVFTSVLPNLLVRGVVEAIRRSRALKVYVCNVMTQPGETSGFSASDHVAAVHRHVGEGLFQCAIVNDGRPSLEVLEAYRREGADVVEPDVARMEQMGVKPIRRDVLSRTDLARHDPSRLARAILELADGSLT